jgi:prefoldin subunit 5
VALGRFTEQIEVLQRQRDDVDRAIADLERTVAVVSGMLREKEKSAGSED